MTKNKERFGCLTKTMTDFLRMSEQERRKKYGYGVNKMYERITKNVMASFTDAQVAFRYLPPKQRDKMDLITSYNSLINYVKKHELAKNLPDIELGNAKTAIKSIIEGRLGKDGNLQKLARPDFEKILYWLYYLENRRHYDTWDPTAVVHEVSLV
jgi:hypothetical protein